MHFTEMPSGLLLDSVHNGQFGGSGAPFDWDRVVPSLRHRVVLAGGLSPDNVARAVRQVQPSAIDVSSGVESQRGIKDKEKMRAFIVNARLAGTGPSVMTVEVTPELFASVPDANGRFGQFGGKFVAETLMTALTELEALYASLKSDASFIR
jgi:hypothetical protein